MSSKLKQKLSFAAELGHPGDDAMIAGLQTNLLRVASDFFWAFFICGFLTKDGELTTDSKNLLEDSVKNMINQKNYTIPNEVLKPLFRFMRYSLLGARHLNKFSVGAPNDMPVREPLVATANNKRKRIISRLAQGYTRAKKRRFPLSRVKDAVGEVSLVVIEDQIRILESHAVVLRPSKRSVQLVRTFSERARAYMVSSCGFTFPEITAVENTVTILID